MKFGDNLRNLREEKGLTQKELGKLLLKKENIISMLENNKIEADFKTLLNISNIFNVSIDFLLGITCDTPMHLSIFPKITDLHNILLTKTKDFTSEEISHIIYFINILKNK